MQERLKYRNHLNEIIDFGENGILVKASDLHDYSWEVSQKNNRISGFRRTVTQRKLPVTIFCPTVAAGVAARNRLMEVTEKDVLAEIPGRIIIGDYYYSCYITQSQKSGYLVSRRMMQANLTITTDKPVWVRESRHTFRKEGAVGEINLDYPYDFTFDYMSRFGSNMLINTDFTASNFRMYIFGPCENPVVYVSGHAYSVRCMVERGEYVTIDSAAKTVTKTATDGNVTNVFNQRGRESYVFERIAPGSSAVTWDGNYSVDIVLLEERSEPKWT